MLVDATVGDVCNDDDYGKRESVVEKLVGEQEE